MRIPWPWQTTKAEQARTERDETVLRDLRQVQQALMDNNRKLGDVIDALRDDLGKVTDV